jgi:hypothetical protein
VNKKRFGYSERNMGFSMDNWINYYAGPFKISISGWNNEIKIICKKKWEYLIEDLIETIKKAWEVEDNQIKVSKEEYTTTEIVVNYNFNNLKLYIEHIITF